MHTHTDNFVPVIFTSISTGCQWLSSPSRKPGYIQPMFAIDMFVIFCKVQFKMDGKGTNLYQLFQPPQINSNKL